MGGFITFPGHWVSPVSPLANRAFLGAPRAAPFRIEPAEFLARARRLQPEAPDATASRFANWVYSLYGQPGSDADTLERGSAAEAVILGERRKGDGARSILLACDHDELRHRRPDWELVHCGMRLESDPAERAWFELHHLSVGGRPLGVSPDLLYRNRRTGEVILVEIKLSRQALPGNLWPNVWAQLWCYAQVPVASDAPKLTVVTEIWGELSKWGRAHGMSQLWIGLRASVRRNPREPAYDRFFRALFDIYRGQDA